MTDINDIIHAARVLHLPLIAETAGQLADQARDQHWTHEQYLAAVLGRQAAVREANGTTTRIKRAHFPRNNTLEDFNWNYQASAPRQTIDHLATSTFISKADNIVFLGPPGVGKTHLATSIGIKACQHGYSVLFKTAVEQINDLNDAHNQGLLARRLSDLNRTNLIIIDELGYIPLDGDAANLLFQLIAVRYETASIIITSNLEFARWGEALTDPTVAAAMIDRLIHHAHVISIDGDSYRTRNRRATSN